MKSEDGLTHLIALTQEVESAFPAVFHSTMAIDGFPETNAVALPLVHRILTSNGWHEEAHARETPRSAQIYFSPEEAVKALRFRWLQYLSESVHMNGHAPYRLCWRSKPELMEYNGCWIARMRFTPIWLDRNGSLKTWPEPLCGASARVHIETAMPTPKPRPWWKRLLRVA